CAASWFFRSHRLDVARRELARIAAREGHHDAVVVHLGNGAAAILRHAHGIALLEDRLDFDPHGDAGGVGAARHAVVAVAALVAGLDRLVEVFEDHLPAALGAARVGGEELDLAALAREVKLHAAVGMVVEERAARLLAVATRAPGFLVIRFQAAGQLVVRDVADVGAVDAHAERVGRDHGARGSAHEGFLRRGALAAAEAAVVELRVDALLAEPRVHLLRRAHGGAVDDARAARAHDFQQRLLLLGSVGSLHHLEVEIGAVHPDVEDAHARPAELARDVLDDIRRGGRGEREQRRVAQLAQRRAEAGIGRAKIVAPLRDAMRLVDDEEVDRVLLQLVDERRVLELLGRGEDEVRVALLDAAQGLAPLARRQRAVHGGRVDAAVLELVGLVLHERDERRHDDRGAAHLQRRQLIAERLAGARRHDGERVAPGEHALDHLALPRPQAPQLERAPQDVAPLHEGRCGKALKMPGALTAGADARWPGESSAYEVTPRRPSAMRISSSRSSSVRTRPGTPAAARPRPARRPRPTVVAPSASALTTSVPRMKPPSTQTSARSLTAWTMSGSTAAVPRPCSSWRPPWLET